MEFGQALRALRIERGLSQEEFAKILGTSKQVISRYENGQRVPKLTVAREYAKRLNISLGYLMGWEEGGTGAEAGNLMQVKRVRIPMLGGIAAGEPIYAEQQYDSYVEADGDLDCTYALRVDGDSMEPTVRYGDVVFIRQQEDVDDGRIAAVLIDDSATLKRVYHIPNGLQLLSDNAGKYPPRTVTFAEHDTIRILGLAVAFKRAL